MHVGQQKQIDPIEVENEGNGDSSSHSRGPSLQSGSNHDVQSLSDGDDENQQSDESKPIVAAIKTMKFRPNRGAKMQELMEGKISKDPFWERNCRVFGGDLRERPEDEDESDYEASSSGRDEFDSDFDLTDSYPGKRGRKKGQKVKRRAKRESTGRPRGRPPKNKPKSESDEEEGSEKGEKRARKKEKTNAFVPPSTKKIYKAMNSKSSDCFTIYKAVIVNKRGPKPKLRPTHGDNEEISISSQHQGQKRGGANGQSK